MPTGACQRCRQPLAFPAASASASPVRTTAVDDSIAALSPSAYDLLSASERAPQPPPPLSAASSASAAAAAPPRVHPPPPPRVPPGLQPLYGIAAQHAVHRTRHHPPPQRLTVPASASPTSAPPPPPPPPALPRTLGPAESFVVLTESVLHPAPSATSTTLAHPSLPSSSSQVASSASASAPPLLTPRLAQLSTLYALLSSTSSVDHPLCTECVEVLLGLLAQQLDDAKKERDRLLGFEKDVARRRQDALKAAAAAAGPGASPPGDVDLREHLERDLTKLRKAEAHAIAELRAVEARKAALADEKATLDAEQAQLAQEEAEFWRQHSLYVVERDELRDRERALETRLAMGQRQLDKLQRTNVYNDAFCIGQEGGFGTINGLRLGRLPGVSVEWPEINAAWGHTLLLLHTIARKFGYPSFAGYRLVPCGSFSCIEKLGDRGEVVQVLELYGSGDFAVTRLLQNRRFDHAMVAFLECLRQLIEWVCARDRKVRLPHAVVKDRIGDVSIKLQFGSDEAWTRALRHVLLDLKILLGRASL